MEDNNNHNMTILCISSGKGYSKLCSNSLNIILEEKKENKGYVLLNLAVQMIQIKTIQQQ